jgi:hypothetical protein
MLSPFLFFKNLIYIINTKVILWVKTSNNKLPEDSET